MHYAFFNTGLEMQAIKQHVKDMAEKYGVEIKEYRPKSFRQTKSARAARAIAFPLKMARKYLIKARIFLFRRRLNIFTPITAFSPDTILRPDF